MQDFANVRVPRHQWHGVDLSQDGIISEFDSETLVETSNHVVLQKLKALGSTTPPGSDGLWRSFSGAAIGGIIFMQSSLSVPRFASLPSSSQSGFEASISSYQPGLAESILTFDSICGPPVRRLGWLLLSVQFIHHVRRSWPCQMHRLYRAPCNKCVHHALSPFRVLQPGKLPSRAWIFRHFAAEETRRRM